MTPLRGGTHPVIALIRGEEERVPPWHAASYTGQAWAGVATGPTSGG